MAGHQFGRINPAPRLGPADSAGPFGVRLLRGGARLWGRRGSQERGVDDLLQMSVRDGRQAVSERYHLALLRKADAAVEAARRLRQYCAVRSAPAAAHSAA